MFNLSHQVLRKQARAMRWGALTACLMPMVGAYLYSNGLHVPLWNCPIRTLTGIPCPTCGMTRSFIAIAKGNWQQATIDHLFGPALFVCFWIAIAHLGVEVITGRKLDAFYLRLLGDRTVQISGLAIFLGYYSLRFLTSSLP